MKEGAPKLADKQITYDPYPKPKMPPTRSQAVDIATGLLIAWPCLFSDQRHTLAAFTLLYALYGRPQVIESNRGTHVTG